MSNYKKKKKITNTKKQTQQTIHDLAPSPSSSSTQESRLDNVSPTPESDAYKLRGGGANVSGLSKMDASETTSDHVEKDGTSIQSTNTTITTMPTAAATATKETENLTTELNSPNANTVSATKAIVKEASNENSSAVMLSTEKSITCEPTTTNSATKEDVDMNNAIAMEAVNAASKVPTSQATEVKKIEQMNGNDMANGNANNTEKDAIKTTTLATATATATNGNNTTAETTKVTTATASTTTSEEDEETNKTKLGKDHLNDDKNLNITTSTRKKLVVPSKNPFGDNEEDDNDDIYELPKGE